MSGENLRLMLTALAALAAWVGAIVAILARRDAREARKSAEAHTGPSLTLTHDEAAKTLYLRNMGQRAAKNVEIEIEGLNTNEESFHDSRATVSPHPAGVTSLRVGWARKDLHGSKVTLRWQDQTGTPFSARMEGDRTAHDGFRNV